MIAIADPDILKQILVKDFENFRSRKVRFFQFEFNKTEIYSNVFQIYTKNQK